MENKTLHTIFFLITVIVIIFIAGYSLVVDYKFPDNQMNYFFSLFYLVLALNFIGRNSDTLRWEGRLKCAIENWQNILLYCVLSACFSIILLHSGVSVIKTALIILIALIVFNFVLVICKRRITLILFWINFYLFAGMLVFSLIPEVTLDLISRYNPLGGLIVTLFI